MSSNPSPQKTEHASKDEEFIEVEAPPSNTQTEPEFASDYEKVTYLAGKELFQDTFIKQILGYFINFSYDATATDPRVSVALDASIKLIQKDYVTLMIDNKDGVLSPYYPSSIPFINGELHEHRVVYENPNTQQELSELVRRGLRARCRTRFPVPVIMVNGKTICRSATLAGGAEIYGRHVLDMFRPGGKTPPLPDSNLDEEIATQLSDEEKWRIITELHAADITLLKRLKIGTIVDLMVENRKAKMGVPVTSSEKYDTTSKYHSNFFLLSMPFPGCEFFKEFHKQDHLAEGLHFDWNQAMCDAELNVPRCPNLHNVNIDWEKYKEWDLITMTQNYIKYIIKYINGNEEGVLIHCISGWDRTPLFISLIRLSLWADGVIHKSLDTHQILFLTLAYDWMLFGHQLIDRLSKNEDILLFCFTALKYLVGDEFSIRPDTQVETKTEGFPVFDEAENRPYIPPPFSPVSSENVPEECNDPMDCTLSLERSTVPESHSKNLSEAMEVDLSHYYTPANVNQPSCSYTLNRDEVDSYIPDIALSVSNEELHYFNISGSPPVESSETDEGPWYPVKSFTPDVEPPVSTQGPWYPVEALILPDVESSASTQGPWYTMDGRPVDLESLISSEEQWHPIDARAPDVASSLNNQDQWCCIDVPSPDESSLNIQEQWFSMEASAPDAESSSNNQEQWCSLDARSSDIELSVSNQDASTSDVESSVSGEEPCCSNTSQVEDATNGWQMVSPTGSIRSSDSSSDLDSVSSQGSNGTITPLNRKLRLTKIRRLFFRCYYNTLTDKHVSYKSNSSLLRGIINNLSDMAQLLNLPKP